MIFGDFDYYHWNNRVSVMGYVPGFEIFGFLGGSAQENFLLVLDVVQTLVVIGLAMGVLNRTVIPSGKRREVNSIDAVVILGMIFGLMMTDFGFRAAKVALGVEPQSWLPISSFWASAFKQLKCFYFNFYCRIFLVVPHSFGFSFFKLSSLFKT